MQVKAKQQMWRIKQLEPEIVCDNSVDFCLTYIIITFWTILLLKKITKNYMIKPPCWDYILDVVLGFDGRANNTDHQ